MTVNRSADCRQPRTSVPRHLVGLQPGGWLCVVMACGFLCAGPGDFRSQARAADEAGDWRAGVAVAVITPAKSMMLAGFGSRTKPSEGTATELHAKALALQDSRGTRLVIVTTDLIGIPRPLRDRVEARVTKRFRLPPASLLLNASHTHCGPELRMTKTALEELSEERQTLTIEYCRRLENALVKLVGDVLADCTPARLSYSHAKAGFAMNRRLKNPDPDGEPYLNHPNPDGPVDHDVPVLQVTWKDPARRAILFGYACHNTTLYVNQYAGDYAGYAQSFLERDHKGTTALFLNGCGGDQNGFPRGTIELSRRHGRTLATAVEAAMQNRQVGIHGPLAVALDHVQIAYQAPPTRTQLEAYLAGKPAPFKSYELTRTHAKRLLRQINRGEKLRRTYDFPVQAVRFGQQLVLVALAGETVVDYSLRLKRELRGRAAVWVSGYNNDVFGYVPSRRLLAEGGYEPRRSMNYMTGVVQPGPFAPSIEERIIGKVHQLLKSLSTD
mgnify:CR=1 FL=1